MKRLMGVLMVAGVLAMFEGVALAQSAPEGTEQTTLQESEQTTPQATEQTAPQGTLDANSLDGDASGGTGVTEQAGAEVLPRNGKILFSGDNFGSPPELETINPDGSNRSSFTPPIIGSNPEWSPDGTKAAFNPGEDTGFRPIAIMSADGTEQTIVPNTAQSPLGASQPTWSPDSAKLAFTTLNDVDVFDPVTGQYITTRHSVDIYTINVDGTQKTNLRGDVPPEQELYRSPDWSPDGAKIAFSRVPFATGREEIYTANADGSGQPTGFPNLVRGRDPAWSPDGSRIAFVRPDFSGRDTDLSVMNADGTGQTSVTTDGRTAAGAVIENAPAWSPDGSKLVFRGETMVCGRFNCIPSRGDIFTINIDGSNRTNLTNTPDRGETGPSWAPAPPDSTEPLTTATPLPEPNNNGWNNSEVKVTLSATDPDDGSGVEKITYSASGAQTIEQKDESGSSVEVTLDQEGTTTLTYFATDKAGNAEDQKTLTVKIDKTPPSVSSTNPANNATGVAATANISATFSESGSGIDLDTFTNSTFQVVQLKPTGNVPVSSGTFSLHEDSEGSQTVTFDPESSLAKGAYRVTLTGVADNAGNVMPNAYTWRFATAGPPNK